MPRNSTDQWKAVSRGSLNHRDECECAKQEFMLHGSFLLSQAKGRHCAGTALWGLAVVTSLQGAPGNIKYKATDFLLAQGVVTQRCTRTYEYTKLTAFALLFIELGSHESHAALKPAG